MVYKIEPTKKNTNKSYINRICAECKVFGQTVDNNRHRIKIECTSTKSNMRAVDKIDQNQNKWCIFCAKQLTCVSLLFLSPKAIQIIKEENAKEKTHYFASLLQIIHLSLFIWIMIIVFINNNNHLSWKYLPFILHARNTFPIVSHCFEFHSLCSLCLINV